MAKTLVATPDPEPDDEYSWEDFYDGDFASLRVDDIIKKMEKQFIEDQ